MRPNHTQDKKDEYVSFPAGIAYIATVLKNKGYEVDIVDLTLEDVDYVNLASRIKNLNPDVIGISALSHAYCQVKKMAGYLKNIAQCKIILGGHISVSYDMVLKNTKIDICVIGEGELTIIDLLENMDSLENVRGIAYKKDGKVVVTLPRELIQDLDSLPCPAYDLMDIDRYSQGLLKDVYMPRTFLPRKKYHKKLAIEASRGCPFACKFCAKMFKNIRRRSVDSVINEIKYLKDNYDVDVIQFHDDLFFFKKELVYEFCLKIKPLKISWFALLRIDIVDREILEMFKRSGCLMISFGVESGSEKILKNMNKNITLLQIEETLKEGLDVGLPLDISLILGYPGEDNNTVQDTINLFKRIGYPAIKFRYVTPYPDSQLYKECIQGGLIENEDKYLESLGDGSGPYRFRFNFTNFKDEELTNLLPKAVSKTIRNYLTYLLTHPIILLKYLFRKDIMNPMYYFYNRWFHPTNYDKAAKYNKTLLKNLQKEFDLCQKKN